MVSLGEHHIAFERLIRVYAELMAGDDVRWIPESEDWQDLFPRISVPGRINEISPGVYRHFLETFRPLLLARNRFCISNGHDALRLFWIADGHHFCRQLKREETVRLCDASGLSQDWTRQ
jgi:hypothetical protein